MRTFIGMGSNLGDRRRNLLRALGALRDDGLAPQAVSSAWETEPIGCQAADPFLNAVLAVEAGIEPLRCLELLLRIEARLGRRRSGVVNEPRVIDLDLLAMGERGERIVEHSRLILPHPRMWMRRFVLAPLREIAPELRHPETGEEIAAVEERLRVEQPGVERRGQLALPQRTLL